jgi:hypothetical protein
MVQPAPARTAFTPRTLTVWLPNEVSLLAGSVRGCSRAHARGLTNGVGRCTQFAGGLLPQDENLRAWFAFAGPMRGEKRLVWLRARLKHAGWQFRMQLQTGEGTATRAGRVRCR